MMNGNSLKKYILIVGVFFVLSAESKNSSEAAPACPQTKGNDLIYPKANLFEVSRYHADTDTYEILSVKFPGEGTSHVTLSALSDSVAKIKSQKANLEKNREDIIGATFTAENDIPTLLKQEVSARKTCARKE